MSTEVVAERRCSFCGRQQGLTVAGRRGAVICNLCTVVVPPGAEPGDAARQGCSFCGRKGGRVRIVLSRDGTAICRPCADLCRNIVRSQRRKTTGKRQDDAAPREGADITIRANEFTSIDPTPLASDLLCVGCGYNLRGLAPHGVCPECVVPVQRSMRGDQLEYADPAWRQRIQQGFSLFYLGGMNAAMTIWNPHYHAGWFSTFVWLLQGAFALVMLLGLWRFTAPDPRLSYVEDPHSLRRCVRVVTVAALAAWPFYRLAFLGVPRAVAATSYPVFGILMLVGSIAGVRYLAQILLRTPSEALGARMCRRVRWFVIWGAPSMLALLALNALMPSYPWLVTTVPWSWVAVTTMVVGSGLYVYFWIRVFHDMARAGDSFGLRTAR